MIISEGNAKSTLRKLNVILQRSATDPSEIIVEFNFDGENTVELPAWYFEEEGRYEIGVSLETSSKE